MMDDRLQYLRGQDPQRPGGRESGPSPPPPGLSGRLQPRKLSSRKKPALAEARAARSTIRPIYWLN